MTSEGSNYCPSEANFDRPRGYFQLPKNGDVYTVELDCDAGEITITHERSQKFAKATHPGLANAALRPLCGIYYKGSKVSLVDSP